MQALPDELVVVILKTLSLLSLRRAACVDKKWKCMAGPCLVVALRFI